MGSTKHIFQTHTKQRKTSLCNMKKCLVLRTQLLLIGEYFFYSRMNYEKNSPSGEGQECALFVLMEGGAGIK